MSDNKSAQNPAELAREAFRQLAIRKIAPTPDAYHKIYDEIAGYAQELGPEHQISLTSGMPSSAKR